MSVHPRYAVGLGLVRLEFAERCWGLAEWGKAPRAKEGEVDAGRLVVNTDGVVGEGEGQWEVWAGKGRAWYTQEELDAAGK